MKIWCLSVGYGLQAGRKDWVSLNVKAFSFFFVKFFRLISVPLNQVIKREGKNNPHNIHLMLM